MILENQSINSQDSLMQENQSINSRDTLLEQYKLYVEMADRVSTRRTDANKFYASLLSALFVILSIVIDKTTFSDLQKGVFIGASVLGLTLCGAWVANIRSYKQLNSLKFKVVHEMEKHLPFSCYAREWEILKQGPKKNSYFRLTRVEQYVPALLTLPYLFLLIYFLIHLG